MVSAPAAAIKEVEGTVFQTILQELERRSNQLEDSSYRIYGSVNRIWDNRHQSVTKTTECDEKDQPMPSDVVGLIYYYIGRIDKSTNVLFTTADLLDRMV